jgi:hypothetical protein
MPPMTEVYRGAIAAPPVAPPRVSLLSTVTVVDEPSTRWEGGYEFVSELSGRAGAEGMEDCLTWFTNGQGDTWTVSADPVVIWAEAPCHTTLGTRSRDWQGMARRLLQARQSAELARWFATSRLSPAAMAGDATPTQDSPALVLAELEDWLGRVLGGPLGTLHMSPGTLAAVVGAGLARLDGARWLTPIGTPIVADAGYAIDGSLSVGGTAPGAVVATGPIRVRLGAIEVADPTTIEAINPATNTLTVVAWRPAAVEWDSASSGGPPPPPGLPTDPAVPYAKGGLMSLGLTGTPA